LGGKIRICHICSYYETPVFHAAVMAQKGETEPAVFFFRPKNAERLYDSPEIDEVNCFNQMDRFFFFLKEKKAYEAYRTLYRDRAFDLNYAHSLFANGYIAYKAYREKGTPYIVAIQNTDLNVFFKYRLHLRAAGVRIALHAKRIVFASECYRDRFLSKYVPKKHREAIRERSVVIPYGIDDAFCCDAAPLRTCPGTPCKVLSVGLICKNKNQLALCKAVEKLREQGMDLQLTVIGKARDRRMARKLARHPFVTVEPFMEKEALKQRYRAHDLFVLASKTETFGLVYAEALSQGLPILYSKGEGFDGQFEDGQVGFAVDPRDVEDIAAGIRKVMARYPDLAGNTVRAAERFRTALIAERYFDLYAQVMGEE